MSETERRYKVVIGNSPADTVIHDPDGKLLINISDMTLDFDAEAGEIVMTMETLEVQEMKYLCESLAPDEDFVKKGKIVTYNPIIEIKPSE